MSSDNTTDQPGFGTRLWRSLIRVLAIIALFMVIVAALVGLGFAGAYGVQEFNTLSSRVRLLRADVDTLMAENDEQQAEIVTLETALAGQERQLTRVEEASTETDDNESDLARQAELLAALEARLDELSESNETQSADLAAVGTGLVALQGDLNDTGSRLDELGGEFDMLQSDVDALNGDVGELASATSTLQEDTTAVAQDVTTLQEDMDRQLNNTNTEVTELRQTMALFHIWELVARARLHVAEDNIGLASNDIEAAINALNVLLEDSRPADRERLETIEMRLALILFNLTEDLEVATLDLDATWKELDLLIALEVLPESVQPEDLAEAEEGG